MSLESERAARTIWAPSDLEHITVKPASRFDHGCPAPAPCAGFVGSHPLRDRRRRTQRASYGVRVGARDVEGARR